MFVGADFAYYFFFIIFKNKSRKKDIMDWTQQEKEIVFTMLINKISSLISVSPHN